VIVSQSLFPIFFRSFAESHGRARRLGSPSQRRASCKAAPPTEVPPPEDDRALRASREQEAAALATDRLGGTAVPTVKPVTSEGAATDNRQTPGQPDEPNVQGDPRSNRAFAVRHQDCRSRAVARTANLEDLEPLRLPRPPRPARVDLAGVDCSESGVLPVVPVVAVVPASAETGPFSLAPQPPPTSCRHSPETAPRRPSLEGLLQRAESLARSMLICDPTARLLQIALLRRDHTLLDAVVRNADSVYARQCSATWRPAAKRMSTPRGTTKHALAHRRGTTERPAARPVRTR
jgi:hypothetical protein